MRTVTEYAVFIEPDGAFREFILDWKARVEAVMPGQAYCGHPPHCTLIVTRLVSVNECSSAIERVSKAGRPFRVTIDDTIVFYDDPGAGGGHTMALRVSNSDPLRQLQAGTSDALAPFVDKRACNEAIPEFATKEPFLSSTRKYGFPFVGKHWIPHFTVASLKTGRNAALISEFTSLRPGFDLDIDRVTLWEVAGDNHRKVSTFKLGA